MELGECLMKKTPLNVLKNCLNPEWGFLWTNGFTVFFKPFQYTVDDFSSKCQTSQVLHQFGMVRSLSWSNTSHQETYVTVISVQETQLILTLWKPFRTKSQISFTQIYCKVLNETHLLCNSGISWHPDGNKFCFFAQTSAVVYAFEDADACTICTLSADKRSRITCGSWSNSGSCMILGSQSKLLYFKIPANGTRPVAVSCGRVCAIESISNDKCLVTTALPLDTLITSQKLESLQSDEIETTSSNSKGCLETLMSVGHDMQCPIDASSKLILLEWSSITEKPSIISEISIPGILSPDLMTWEEESSLCAVGSNNSSTVYFFRVSENSLLSCTELDLHDLKNPRGIAIFNKEVWVMESKLLHSKSSQTSVPSDKYFNCNKYNISLNIVPLNKSNDQKKLCTNNKWTTNWIASDSSVNVPVMELNKNVHENSVSVGGNNKILFPSECLKVLPNETDDSVCTVIESISKKHGTILEHSNKVAVRTDILNSKVPLVSFYDGLDKGTVHAIRQEVVSEEIMQPTSNSNQLESCPCASSGHNSKEYVNTNGAEDKDTGSNKFKHSIYEYNIQNRLNILEKIITENFIAQQKELQEIKQEVAELKGLVAVLVSLHAQKQNLIQEI